MPRFGNSSGSSGVYTSSRGRSGKPIGAFDSWMDNQFTYNDTEYLKEIEQYKDEPWYDYLLTNPWMWSKQGQFSPSIWNSISSVVGDYSAEANYFNQIKSNRSQWLSEFIEKMRQQDYNSPLQQAQREREAGLNPDLTGNISAGAAAENDQPMLDTPISGFGSDDLVPKLGSFFMSIYSLASGFAKDMFSFQSMSNQLTSEDLAINKEVVSQATEYIRGAVGLPEKYKDDDGVERWRFPDLSLDKLENYASVNFRSRHARKRFINEVKSSYGSARSNFARFGVITDAEDAKVKMAKSLGVQESYGSNGGFDLDPIIEVSKELNQLSIDLEKLNLTYMKDYYSSADGSLAGKAANANNEGVIAEQDARSYQRAMDKVLNETMNRIVRKLESTSDKGGFDGLLAKGMLMYLSAFRLQMIPSLPSVNLSGLVQSKNFYSTTNNNLLE